MLTCEKSDIFANKQRKRYKNYINHITHPRGSLFVKRKERFEMLSSTVQEAL